jgi:hypothetical protein
MDALAPCGADVSGVVVKEDYPLPRRKSNARLSPDEEEVVAMGLKEFERRFGFRPVDALEKFWFASNAQRIAPATRDAIDAGVMGEYELSHVNMQD